MVFHIRAIATGLVVAAIGLCGVAWIDSIQTEKRVRELALETRLTGRGFAARVDAALERHIVGIEQMANFWENSSEVTEQEFDEFAASTLRLNPGCLRIVALDAAAKVRWVYPVEPNRSLIGFDVRTHREGYENFNRSRASHHAALSSPLLLVGGAKGFAITASIFRNGTFVGAVVGSIRVDDFFSALALEGSGSRYGESVTDSGMSLFEKNGSAIAAATILSTDRLECAGRVWSVSVAPLPAVVSASIGTGRAALWALGALAALLTGCASAVAIDRMLATRIRLRTQGATIEETRGRLDTAMRQLIQAEKMTALGELVSGVAHEINNPLATILGYSQLALRQGIPDGVRRYIETSASEAERAGRIVRNLLTFARKSTPEKKYSDLNEIVSRATALKVYHFRVGQITMVEDLERGLPKTLLDPHQIQQIVLNLLNNAEHAVAAVPKDRMIRIETRCVDGKIRLSVSDNGPGVPTGLREQVFEPFFTTKSEDQGTGLGLSISKKIIEQHHGVIRVEGEPGRGATFVIDLPIVVGRRASDREDASGLSQRVKPSRLLIVDDEATVLSFLVDLLEAQGHSVETAGDVPEAQRKIATTDFDAIISDMKMPHGSGKDVYDAALSKSADLGRRIVFTTGDGSSAETQRFIRETGASVVLKPFRIKAIEDAIAHAIEAQP